MPLVALVATVSLAASWPGRPPSVAPQEQRQTTTIFINGTVDKLAVPDCVPKKADEATQAACRALTQVLRADLQFEGLFQFVSESMMGAIPPLDPAAPRFDDWKGIGATILVATTAEVAGNDMHVEVRVYSLASGTAMMQRRYSGKVDNPRTFAHQASDDILPLAQYKGVARTRIAFVSDRDAQKGKPSKELYIADYDGFNPRRVTVNGSLNMLPAWRPDGAAIVYVSYVRGAPLLFLAKIFEGQSVPNLSGERGDGQSFSPTFSPDGKSLAFASNRGGSMDVYVAAADGSGAKRLTTTQSNDTAPCFSPTGQEIAFTSDRTGTPQLWQMDSEGLNVRRLTVGSGNWNDGCAWSPSKQESEIAYTARLEAGGFDIAIINLATRQVRQITQGRGSCEYPSWAPNGRHLVFSCQRGRRWELTISDRDGRSFQVLATGPGNNVQPDWGP